MPDLQVLPFFMFYRGADGLLTSFSASVSKVQRLRSVCTITTFCKMLRLISNSSRDNQIRAALWSLLSIYGSMTRTILTVVVTQCDVKDSTPHQMLLSSCSIFMSVDNVACRDAIAEHNTDRCYVSKNPGMEQFPDVKPHAVVRASISISSRLIYVHMCNYDVSAHMCVRCVHICKKCEAFAGEGSFRPA